MAPALNALTTVAAVKDELVITGAASDSILERYIDSISAEVEQFLGRELRFVRNFVERLDGRGSRHLYVGRSPLHHVSVILVDDSSIDLDRDTVLISNRVAGELFREVGWPWGATVAATIGRDPIPESEDQNVTLTYDGGFVLPNDQVTDQEDARMATFPATTLTFADANPDTITRSAGDWSADGFLDGHFIRVRGTEDNDGVYLVDTAVPLVLTLDPAESLTAEAAVADVDLDTIPILPHDLEQAALDGVVSKFRNRGADRSLVSEKLLSAAVTHDRGGLSRSRASALPDPVERSLEKYRRIFE